MDKKIFTKKDTALVVNIVAVIFIPFKPALHHAGSEAAARGEVEVVDLGVRLDLSRLRKKRRCRSIGNDII